jgi:hypothetical protein
MSAFEVVLIIVAVVALLLLATRYFRPRSVVKELGESPRAFAHPEDRPLRERPSEDTRDAPVPKRRLRGRT